MSGNITRREFSHRFFVTAVTTVVANSIWKGNLVASVSTAAVNDGTLTLKLSDYPALNQAFGSVRIGLTPVGFDDFPAGNFYPLLINRVTSGSNSLIYVLSTR